MRKPVTATEGETLDTRRIGPITQTDIVRFAGAGGDFNPLHHDPLTARDAGFGSVIAMGQMQAGMLAAFVTDRFGVEHLREFSVKFTAPVRVGDHLELVGKVTGVGSGSGNVTGSAGPPGAESATALATLDLAVVAGGATIVSGTATVLVRI
jgi:3-hydroxybutyryl-CoA dehydratase